MKPWLPIVLAVPLAAGIATWTLLTDTGQTAPLTGGVDPGEIACTTLITGDYLALLHDGEAAYSQWGTDVLYLAEDAAQSSDHGIATAAQEIVDYIGPDGEFAPIVLHPMTETLANACVAAGHITDTQVMDAKGR